MLGRKLTPRTLLSLLRYVTVPQWREHALRTLLTATGLTLGVAVVIAMRLVNGAVFSSIRESVNDTAGRAVLSVTNGQAGLPEELLERVRGVAGVGTAAALILDSGLVLDHPERGERLQVFGVDYLADSEIRGYQLEKAGGDGATEMEDPIVVLSQPSSIFVTRTFADSHGLRLGAPLRLQTTTGPIELTVRGILADAGTARAFGGLFALMDIYAAQLAFGKGVAGEPGRFDQIDVVLDDGVSVEEAQPRIAAAVAGTAIVSRPEARGEQMESLLSASKLGFTQAQVLACVVGAFLVYNTMAIAVVQRRREIGMLRAIGATAPSIRTLFLVEAAFVAVLGSAAGIAGGWWLAHTLLPLVERMMSDWLTPTSVRPPHISAAEVAIGIGAGVGVSLLATLVPSVQAGRVSPLVALRRDAALAVDRTTILRLAALGLLLEILSLAGHVLPRSDASNALALSAIGCRLAGTALLMPALVMFSVPALRRGLGAMLGIRGRLAGDNLGGAPGRTAITLTAVMVGISAWVVVATLMRSLEVSMDWWIDNYIDTDLSVVASNRISGPSSNRIPGDLVDGIRSLPGVRIVRPYRVLRVPYEGDLTVLLSLDMGVVRRQARYRIVEGAESRVFQEQLNRGEGVGVSDAFSAHFGKHVGDTITLDSPTGPHTFRVLGTFADWAGPTGSIHIDRKLFLRHWQQDLVDGIDVDLVDRQGGESVAAAIRERYGARYDLQIMTVRELKSEIRSQVIQGFQMTKASEIVVLLISALGVVNTLLAAILDRTREIGILRAIGATRAQISGAVLVEAGLLGALGALIGIAVGLANAYPFIKVSLLELVGWHVDFHVSPPALAAAVGLAVLVSMAAGYYPARKASRLDVLQAIQYE